MEGREWQSCEKSINFFLKRILPTMAQLESHVGRNYCFYGMICDREFTGTHGPGSPGSGQPCLHSNHGICQFQGFC